MKTNINIVNKKVKFEYEFIQTEIAGIVLMGSEVKSIRAGKISISESHCVFIDGELYLKNSNITEIGSAFTHKSDRDRKLLLKKQELEKLKKQLTKGLTVVPYRIFSNERGLIKIEIVLARGKKQHDKRESIKTKEVERSIKRIQK